MGVQVSVWAFEGWKPQQVWGLRRNWILSHTAQDTSKSWFWGCCAAPGPNPAFWGHFWAILKALCVIVVEFESETPFIGTRKASRFGCITTVSDGVAILAQTWAHFAKMAELGQFCKVDPQLAAGPLGRHWCCFQLKFQIWQGHVQATRLAAGAGLL